MEKNPNAVNLQRTYRFKFITLSYYSMISVRVCGELSIEDGSVDTGLSIEGLIANYTCDTGFRLVGDDERVCLSNGLWSGTNPACQGMNFFIVDT